MSNYEKLSSSLRYWLLGKEWYLASKALDFAGKFHTGLRKDGVTKEFEHQIFQAHMVRTYHKNLLFPEETMIVAFLHDIVEDYDVSVVEIENKFGNRVASGVERMTKVHRGQKKDINVYFEDIIECPMASVCKGTDRFHNQLSMDGVFKLEKQEEYIDETETYILPALKKARRIFPEQELVYENLKLMIKQQITLYKSMHQVIKKNSLDQNV